MERALAFGSSAKPEVAGSNPARVTRATGGSRPQMAEGHKAVQSIIGPASPQKGLDGLSDSRKRRRQALAERGFDPRTFGL